MKLLDAVVVAAVPSILIQDSSEAAINTKFWFLFVVAGKFIPLSLVKFGQLLYLVVACLHKRTQNCL